MSKKTLIWVLVGLAVVVLVVSLVAYFVSDQDSALSGGPVSILLAALAAKVRQKELQELKEEHDRIQKEGLEALKGADKALSEMEETDEVVYNSTPEELTQKGNDLFGKGS